MSEGVPSSGFVPPYPYRFPTPPSMIERLRLAHRNFLAMWEDEAFDLEFTEGRILARKVFVCNCPRAVQFAFSLNHASFERKSPQMRHALMPLLGDGLFVSDGETWRQRRRIVAPIVHISRMADFAPTMVEAAVERAERWERAAGAVDIVEECAHLTAEIISRTVFGQALGREYAAEVVSGFTDYQRAIGQVDLISFLGLPDWLPRYRGRRVRQAVDRIHGVLEHVIERHRGDFAEDGRSSVIQGLLQARDEAGQPLSNEAIRNEAAVLFMAGHETTANALAWAFYLISQDEAVERRLHAELDTVLGGRQPALEDVEHLAYTRAVVDETLRLYPPVPILPREATKRETFEGHDIPPGSLVLVVPWLLHRHRKLWSDPDVFKPERFLPGAEPISKFQYVPFSIGPRICAGMSFGLVEATLCLATIAQRVQLRLEPGRTIQPVCRLTLRPEGGLMMRARRRSAKSGPAVVEARPGIAGKCPYRHA